MSIENLGPYSQEEIDEMNRSREESDRQLVQEGAKMHEGWLGVTEEQYQHLHKEMEDALKIEDKEGGDIVDYIIGHVEGDIHFQPSMKSKIIKSIEALLKASKTAKEDQAGWMLDSIHILSQLENRGAGVARDQMVILHETKKAAMWFSELDDPQRLRVQEWIDSMKEGQVEQEPKQSLEQFFMERLGMQSKKNWNPDDYNDERVKVGMAALAMFNSGNLEDFHIDTRDRISNETIDSIVREYYQQQGFEVSEEYGSYIVKNDMESYYITVSNWGDQIMVSVARWDF